MAEGARYGDIFTGESLCYKFALDFLLAVVMPHTWSSEWKNGGRGRVGGRGAGEMLGSRTGVT